MEGRLEDKQSLLHSGEVPSQMSSGSVTWAVPVYEGTWSTRLSQLGGFPLRLQKTELTKAGSSSILIRLGWSSRVSVDTTAGWVPGPGPVTSGFH